MSIHGAVHNCRRGVRRLRVAVLATGTLALLAACLPETNTTAVWQPASSAAGKPAPAATPQPAALTPQQQAGQRIIYSYPGLTPPESLLRHIRNGEAAGVIFFGENISSTSQIASVVQQLRQAQQQSPVRAPLLLMTDQEGGQVRRLPGEPAQSAKQVGQSANPPAQASQTGTAAGRNLSGVGMNVNLAPVLDVFYTPGNFIDQYQRSYSNDAGTVSTLGRNFITAQQQAGVAATAKHFPGLGSAARGENTDTRPVTVNVGLSTLRNKDEVPYSSAIAGGVKLIMLSWAVYPALDSARPAGLSPTVVGSELRNRLGYRGVTVTDALEAGALNAYGAPRQRAVLSAQAGMDLIMCSARDVGQGEDATTGLVNALAAGQLDRAAFQASVDRVTALRNTLH
ncbi:glycoside hydrolase family 3 N-terminal domain-containing protein [Planosporangium mesophilum]|uniref:Glycoside hydrolase family 3 n=1 Tax=Planosporangium mesophilum TaxID=689768 RepID=A0A8J3TF99_9ACTN|nr:glycoside hydrolase family 3 N-terminal domain-containing protein [Planosporangium mesophilum]NJC86630.1 beta-N-acetylhexosaminidase [Planosporangium mesophilum]GII25808.1 glycoside hydrolase family 3 [Planosporangium mesophilum]